MEFTTASAKKMANEGLIAEWVQEYLRGEGDNAPLADGLLLTQRYYLGPMELPLEDFQRNTGPEINREFQVTLESFQANIKGIQERLNQDWDMPPLLIQYDQGTYQLSDGNHRHAALMDMGKRDYSIIFWCSSEKELEELKKTYC